MNCLSQCTEVETSIWNSWSSATHNKVAQELWGNNIFRKSNDEYIVTHCFNLQKGNLWGHNEMQSSCCGIITPVLTPILSFEIVSLHQERELCLCVPVSS